MDPVSNACNELFAHATGLDAIAGRLLVAFSGGMDSAVLLHAVTRAAARYDALDRVLAVHVDHGLDPESGRWAERCAAVASALRIGFEGRTLALTPGSNLEARARAARYEVFESLLREGDVLLLAHHAGDQLESQLLHLFQGRGLYGMPVGRTLGAGQLRRPLLALPREALAGYARSHDLVWTEDPSNRDELLDRNYLRHELLPVLSRRFPGLAKRIGQVAENLNDMTAAMDELAYLDRRPLPLAVFDGLSQPARLALLRRWLTRHAQAGGISRLALTEFLAQLEAGNDRQPSLSLGNGRLVRYQRALHLVLEAPELAPSYPVAVPGVLRLPHGELEISRSQEDRGQAGVRVSEPLSVSFATEGLRMRSGGHDRNVRDLMRQAGVAPWLRDTLPLVRDDLGIAVIPGVAARDISEEGDDLITITVSWTGEVR